MVQSLYRCLIEGITHHLQGLIHKDLTGAPGGRLCGFIRKGRPGSVGVPVESRKKLFKLVKE